MPSSKVGSVGRPRINGDQTMARFPPGTLDRVRAVLRPGETVADFLREAVMLEAKRREGPPVGGPDAN